MIYERPQHTVTFNTMPDIKGVEWGRILSFVRSTDIGYVPPLKTVYVGDPDCSEYQIHVQIHLRRDANETYHY